MSESELKILDWYLTGTTNFCDDVGGNVTLIVYHDGRVNCTGYIKYAAKKTKKAEEEMKSKSKKLGKKLNCEGLECPKMVEYKNKAFCV